MSRQGNTQPRVFDIRHYLKGWCGTPPEPLQVIKDSYTYMYKTTPPKDHWLYKAQGLTMRQLLKQGIQLVNEDLVAQVDYHYMPLWEYEQALQEFTK